MYPWPTHGLWHGWAVPISTDSELLLRHTWLAYVRLFAHKVRTLFRYHLLLVSDVVVHNGAAMASHLSISTCIVRRDCMREYLPIHIHVSLLAPKSLLSKGVRLALLSLKTF